MRPSSKTSDCDNSFGLVMSLHMLVETDAGFDSTASGVCGWAHDAGFRDGWVEPLDGVTSVAIAVECPNE